MIAILLTVSAAINWFQAAGGGPGSGGATAQALVLSLIALIFWGIYLLFRNKKT